MCLATESSITAAIRWYSAERSASEMAGRPANTGWKYRLVFIGRPGRTVRWVPDSIFRIAGSMVAGSGTYCSTR